MPVISPPTSAPAHETKELRLALVCYGGVSLAVYMHGVTRELESLARASAVYASAPDKANPFLSGSVEHVYWRLFDECRVRDGYVTRFVVDIISGTSAGGINGICLAKAIAHNRRQTPLRDVWLERGDVNLLMANPILGLVPTRTGKLIAWGATTLAPALIGGGRPPFDGQRLLRWIHDALGAVDRQAAEQGGASLLPEGHVLQLLITVTDIYGYNHRVPTYDPKRVTDRRHRHVLSFRSTHDGLGAKNNSALAFAARTTSSFPGAFPPTALADVASLGDTDWHVDRFTAEQFRIYTLSDAAADQTHFIDGGVLDNYPFDLAIAAIYRQPAGVEVDRRVLYIEPDPVAPLPAPAQLTPRLLATIWSSIAGLPREEPVLDQLLDLRRFNERVQAIRDVVIGQFDAVRKVVSDQRQDRYRPWSDSVTEDLGRRSNPGHALYVRVKLHSVLCRLARLTNEILDYPIDSLQAMFVQDTILEWGRERNLLGVSTLTDDAVTFLRTFDLDYGERRLRFVIQGINEAYRRLGQSQLGRKQIDHAKGVFYGLLYELSAVMEDVRNHPRAAEVKAILGRDVLKPYIDAEEPPQTGVRRFLRAHAGMLDQLRELLAGYLNTKLSNFGTRIFAELPSAVEGWPMDEIERLEVRLLGFPLWDMLIFPLREVSDVGELDPVEVIRMSPRDVHLLDSAATSNPKLQGVPLGHFAAFFSRRYRENDYLWGRLDAAERLIHVLRSDQTARPGDHPSSPLYLDAFAAIVREERGSLSTATVLCDAVERQVAELRCRTRELRQVT